MAIPWVQVYSNLPSHPKVTRLADELNLSSAVVDPDTVAVGILVSLWTWAIQNAYTGDLSAVSDRSIAAACRWKRKPETLVRALTAAGWLDDDRRIHDWEEYSMLLIDAEDQRRKSDRERAKRYRDRKRDASRDGNGDDHASVRQNHGPTIPYKTNSDDDGDARAREDLLWQLKQEDWLEAPEDVRATARAVAADLFGRFGGREPTETDVVCVYREIRTMEGGAPSVSRDRTDVLTYAMEQAARAGQAGNWLYIQGVLRRMAGRGIVTLVQAADYDDDRAAGR